MTCSITRALEEVLPTQFEINLCPALKTRELNGWIKRFVFNSV
jgi:hypothetical protein